ncbi:MAG: hypothetical protein K5986_08740 [Clostridium sp.]|uniref:hypothetical protein n=1 Tax=Clostridium sp. DSM 8431 TaxID=1761781 RepID=UPI0008DF481C|nr:hypothetical protein [Clostridium sp. DSM 8431]MCR4944517.1 hypothetical protein [Clostridium sp.]SFU87147.1 hypothetical protein SAMN04487886_12462 [Clostridium sp. DSM 8431]
MPKRLCPLCGGNNTSKILWGMPAWSPELEEDLQLKKIVLGGCCIPTPTPKYHCNDCDKHILYTTEEDEIKTYYFKFGIGVFFDGHSRIEVEKSPKGAYARYYPSFENAEKEVSIKLTDEQFFKYIHKIYCASIMEWKEEYDNPNILDGTQWGVTIKYYDGKEKNWYGNNDYPPLWNKFLKAVNQLPLPNIY